MVNYYLISGRFESANETSEYPKCDDDFGNEDGEDCLDVGRDDDKDDVKEGEEEGDGEKRWMGKVVSMLEEVVKCNKKKNVVNTTVECWGGKVVKYFMVFGSLCNLRQYYFLLSPKTLLLLLLLPSFSPLYKSFTHWLMHSSISLLWLWFWFTWKRMRIGKRSLKSKRGRERDEGKLNLATSLREKFCLSVTSLSNIRRENILLFLRQLSPYKLWRIFSRSSFISSLWIFHSRNYFLLNRYIHTRVQSISTRMSVMQVFPLVF